MISSRGLTFIQRNYFQVRLEIIMMRSVFCCKFHFLIYLLLDMPDKYIYCLMGSESIQKVRSIPCGISPDESKRRIELFKQFDVNNNGYLSLAQIDKGVRDVLVIPELFDTKPVMMRAYKEAAKKFPSKHSYGDDYVSKAEFRYLLMYLRVYWELWEDFDHIEVDGDRRISLKEFLNGYKTLERWGVFLKDPQATFEELLKYNNANANLTFTQFSAWMAHNYLKHFNTANPDHDILF